MDKINPLTPHFSSSFLALRISYLKSELEKLPSGYTYFSKEHEYVRVTKSPQNHKVPYTRSVDTEAGKKIKEQVLKYQYFKQLLNKTNSLWRQYYGGPVPTAVYTPSRSTPRTMTAQYYQQAVGGTNPHEFDATYIFEGISMRSRFEVMAAKILRELDIDFKYEVSITTHEGTYSIDILAFIPEKNRCIGFEFAGRFGDPKYMQANAVKLIAYSTIDLVPNRDIYWVWGGKNWLPSMDELKRVIICAIENC